MDECTLEPVDYIYDYTYVTPGGYVYLVMLVFNEDRTKFGWLIDSVSISDDDKKLDAWYMYPVDRAEHHLTLSDPNVTANVLYQVKTIAESYRTKQPTKPTCSCDAQALWYGCKCGAFAAERSA